MITHEKFILLKESLKAISNGNIGILNLYGSPGTGKTFTALNYLNKNNINYAYINSYTTPLSFYELLYKNRDKDVVLFDDTYGMNNPIIMSMFKSACWTSNGSKIVSYYSTSKKLEDKGLPESFEFNANVISIFNLFPLGYEPIINRGVTINFEFTFKEKIKIFEEIKEEANIEDDVLNYIKLNCKASTKNLSIRTLVILSKLKRSGQDFKIFAKEILPFDEDKQLLISMTCKEWCDRTGMHRASYFRKKKEIKQ